MGATDHLRPFLATFFVFFAFSSAQPPLARSASPPLVVLADGTVERLLGTDQHLLRDRSGTLTIAQVSSPEGGNRFEWLTPAETFAFLKEYLHHVVPAIESNGGLVDKYIGDAVMALFPGSSDDALSAALAMQREVGRVNRDLAPGQEPLAIGIGLHRGRLMLGTMGDSKRLDVTVISDVVNVASRLESLTKEKDAAILVSGEIVASLSAPQRFSLEKIGSTTIRGRVQPVEIWAARVPGDSTT